MGQSSTESNGFKLSSQLSNEQSVYPLHCNKGSLAHASMCTCSTEYLPKQYTLILIQSMQKWNSDQSPSLVDKLSINGDLVTWINHEVFSAFIPKEMHQSTICQHG